MEEETVKGDRVTWLGPQRPVEGGTVYVRPAKHDFKTSSFCNGGGCVVVGLPHDIEAPGVDGMVMVRDSKDQTNMTLTYTVEEWRDFVAGVKNGDFDL